MIESCDKLAKLDANLPDQRCDSVPREIPIQVEETKEMDTTNKDELMVAHRMSQATDDSQA